MTQQNNHGGKRAGAGRKKLPKGKKKVCIQIYEPEEVVRRVGGMKKAKSLCSSALKTA